MKRTTPFALTATVLMLAWFAILFSSWLIIEASVANRLANNHAVTFSRFVFLQLHVVFVFIVGLGFLLQRVYKKRLLREFKTLLTQQLGGESSHALSAREDSQLLVLKEMVQQLKATQLKLLQTEHLATLGYFSGGLAHQIGNPLSAALQYLETLKLQVKQQISLQASKPELTQELLQKITKQLNRIHRAIEGLLRLAQPQRLEHVPLKLATWLQNLLDELQTNHGQTAQIKLMVDPTLVFATDPYALEQIMLNLIGNAIEAQDMPAKLDLSAKNDQESLQLIIRDYGPGFPAKFDVNNVLSTSKSGGTGLGLPLARRLIELLGGTLNIENRQDPVGGCVIVTLPRKNA